MRKSQLNAISRSYAEKNQKELIEKTGQLKSLFEFQTQYKSLNGFLKSEKIDFDTILENLESRKEQLEKVSCTSPKYTNVIECIEFIKTILE